MSNELMRIVRLAAPSSVAVIGTLLLCSGIGWLVVLHYENRLDPEAAKLITNDWTPPWALRVMVLVGLMLLIWAGGVTLYKFLCKKLRQ